MYYIITNQAIVYHTLSRRVFAHGWPVIYYQKVRLQECMNTYGRVNNYPVV
jgi:hypothetical protein